MEFLNASSDALIKPLSAVIGIVERRSTMPILANILMRKDGSKVEFVATDLEMQITTHVDVGVGTESSEVTVLARKLFDILRALPSAANVKINLDESMLNLSSDGNEFQLQTLPGKDFPDVEQPDTWANEFSLSQRTLLRLFTMVSFAMANKDIRYYLNGISLIIQNDGVEAVATDGHRLAYTKESVEGINGQEGQSIIIPSKTVIEMQRLLDDSDEPVHISIDQSQIRFKFGDIEFISKLVEGSFPDYNRVIPTSHDRFITLKRETLQRSLQRAAILVANDRLHGIKLKADNQLLKISSHNKEQEKSKIELPIDYENEAYEVGFNVNYLLDALATIRSEEIILSFKSNSEASPVLLTVPNEENFKYVVMPLRI